MQEWHDNTGLYLAWPTDHCDDGEAGGIIQALRKGCFAPAATISKGAKRMKEPVVATMREQIAKQIKQYLAGGQVRAGDALPSERELAVQMGVSRETVRAALGDLEREGLVGSDGYRRRVLVVPAQATALMTRTLGLLTMKRIAQPDQKAPGWERFFETGAADAARELGYHCLSLYYDLFDQHCLDELLEHPLGGVVVFGSILRSVHGAMILDRLRARGLPLVVCGSGEALPQFHTVDSDHRAGAYELTRWLIARGRTRIVMHLPMAGRTLQWLDDRQAGYRQAMQEAGLEPLPMLSHKAARADATDANQFFGRMMEALGYLYDYRHKHGPMDALMMINDGFVSQFSAAFRHMGLTPGQDVLLTGYDNYWSDCAERQWEPAGPAATIDKNNPEIGKAAVKILADLRSGAIGPAPVTLKLPPTLVELGR